MLSPGGTEGSNPSPSSAESAANLTPSIKVGSSPPLATGGYLEQADGTAWMHAASTRVDGPSLKPTRFFDGRHWEEAQLRRIVEGGLQPLPA